MRLSAPKRLLATLLSGLAAIVVLVGALQPFPFVDNLLQVAQIILAVALVIGALNVVLVHLRALRNRMPGLGYRLVLVVATIMVVALELVAPLVGGSIGATTTAMSTRVFQYVYQPLAMSVLGLLVFFALQATWRALATRPGEAWIVVIVAVVFLLASGPWAALVPGLPETLAWMTIYPANGVARGLLLGISIAAVVATVRLLLGFDQPYLDR
ncbi:MAG: hypothetical protein AVDCRST_MAG93-3166 [uncultured Chloroflexia bacterium]|uniref:Uncharacterized protein n=1 Tax=uncultured Chloroflexia bacterium TaxID=1672391 RepID=A0A6J4JKH9_9CHLR|nr:MAG: hypothetical protein AVDCRST_MAG93-3166 [uncultured Chloroflexia bacterium]